MRGLVLDGTRRHDVLLAIALVPVLAAVAETAALTLSRDPDWGSGITGVVAAMTVAGLVVGVRYNPLNDIATRNRRSAQERTSRESRRSFLDLLVLDLVLIVLGLPFGGVLAIREGDPSAWFLSLVFGFLSAIALLLAWLVDMFVVLPIVSMVGALIGAKGSSRTAASAGAVFLSVLVFAVAVTVAVPSTDHGYLGRAGRFLEAMGVLAGLPFRDAANPALLWLARLALVLLVLSITWLVREGRVLRHARGDRPRRPR